VDQEKLYESLALAPISVNPVYQRKGIGTQLINEGIKRSVKSGYNSIVVLGHAEYYPKFGFDEAAKYDIKVSFNVPSEVFMINELIKYGLKDVKGTVIYPEEFIM
jgi:predicted N-acetyltransferase YhbS